MPESDTRKLAAIMFTDIVSYSEMMHRDELLALRLLNEHNQVLRALFPQFGGREVKSTGDGFLVEFTSVVEATRCAVAIQRELATRNQAKQTGEKVMVRIGLHAGDVVSR